MRMRFIIGFITLFFILLLVRIYYLCIKSNAYYEELSLKNSIKTEYLPPIRGAILDKYNTPLAINQLGFSISIKPHLYIYKKEEELEKILSLITGCLKEQDYEKLYKTYKRQDSYYNQDYIEIIDFVDYDSGSKCYSMLNLIDDIKVFPATKRYYPYAHVASHIIGYVGKANTQDVTDDDIAKITGYVGRSGMERYYNSYLQGEKGVKKIKVNALNKDLGTIFESMPKSKDIKLNIDFRLQKYLSNLYKDKEGAVIILNIENGEILAAGSYPEYDLNPFVGGISQAKWDEIIKSLKHPFTNKLVNGLYPPGSIIKMGVGLSFLESGKLDASTTYNCTGTFLFGGRKFRCHALWGHGKMNLNDAIRASCDDYFYKGSLKVGIDAISDTLMELGFGQKTGVDLPNEFVGVVPNKFWKSQKFNQPWYNGETLITSIGQGNFLSTPMQVAVHMGILAKGYKVTPHFINQIGDEKVVFEKEQVIDPANKQNLLILQKAMYDVANHIKGTATRHFKNSYITLAAKTGTAQVVGISQNEKKRMLEEDMEYYTRSHAWVSAYGPYENPKYAVVVLVEHGGHGGVTSGPLVADIFNKLVEYGYIDIKYVKKEFKDIVTQKLEQNKAIK